VEDKWTLECLNRKGTQDVTVKCQLVRSRRTVNNRSEWMKERKKEKQRQQKEKKRRTRRIEEEEEEEEGT